MSKTTVPALPDNPSAKHAKRDKEVRRTDHPARVSYEMLLTRIFYENRSDVCDVTDYGVDEEGY